MAVKSFFAKWRLFAFSLLIYLIIVYNSFTQYKESFYGSTQPGTLVQLASTRSPQPCTDEEASEERQQIESDLKELTENDMAWKPQELAPFFPVKGE